MAFDPDEYLNETGTTSSTATAEFDPDAYLKETEEQEAPFDPDAYLAEVEAPEQPAPPVGTSLFEEIAALPQALQQGIEQPTEAMAETASALGMPALEQTLRGVAEAPEGYVPAAQRFMEPQEGEFQIAGFAPQFLPRAAVEQAPQVIGTILSGIGGRAIGGALGLPLGPKGAVAGQVAGQFLGPALFEMGQIVGPVARERAANQGREEPNTDDLAWAWATAGASGALNAIGAKYLPFGDDIASGLAKSVSKAFAGEFTTEGAQAVVQQAGESFLTEKGLDIKPKQALGEAIIGGVSGGGVAAAAAPFTPAVKAAAAAETKVVAEQAAPVAPETAQVVSEQANQVIAQAQAEETTETPDERVARLQREAQEAAGDIELEEEPPVSGLPPVSELPPVKEGFVRLYHGGAGATAGEFTPYLNTALGYAQQSKGSIFYVDVPEDSEFLRRENYDERGNISERGILVSRQSRVPDDIALMAKRAASGFEAEPVTPTPEAPPVEPVAPVEPVVAAEGAVEPTVTEVAPEVRDAEYVASVERGDNEAAQRLVDSAFRAATTPETTDSVFERHKDFKMMGLTLDEIAQNPEALAEKDKDDYDTVMYWVSQIQQGNTPTVVADEKGSLWDGFHRLVASKIAGSDTINVFTSEKETSTDQLSQTVRRDAEGNVIPLSERFPVAPTPEVAPAAVEPTPVTPPVTPEVPTAETLPENWQSLKIQDKASWLSGQVAGTVVGSAAREGQANDIDIRVEETQAPDAVAKLQQLGYETAGESLVSPEEAQQAGKDFGGQWARSRRMLRYENGRLVDQVDIWSPDTTPEITPQLEPLRRVAKAEQTEEDVAGLVDAGFAEVYKGQPVLTQAGLDALPEAERPRLTPEARKIQIDTGANEVAAEAISKNLRIGVDQIDPNVRLPEGWTQEGDVYVPPQQQAVTPAPTPEVREARGTVAGIVGDPTVRAYENQQNQNRSRLEKEVAAVPAPAWGTTENQKRNSITGFRDQWVGRWNNVLGRAGLSVRVDQRPVDEAGNRWKGTSRVQIQPDGQLSVVVGRGTEELALRQGDQESQAKQRVALDVEEEVVHAIYLSQVLAGWDKQGDPVDYANRVLAEKTQKIRTTVGDNVFRTLVGDTLRSYYKEILSPDLVGVLTQRVIDGNEAESFTFLNELARMVAQKNVRGITQEEVYYSVVEQVKQWVADLLNSIRQFTTNYNLLGTEFAADMDGLIKEYQALSDVLSSPEAVAPRGVVQGILPTPTFTEGTPEAATLKEMEASMAKVDAASEAKGGKPETYKISEIASVWMDSGLGERELQDAIVEYTNLTPANAKKVARAIAKQYDTQQQLAEAVLETEAGVTVEGLPEGMEIPKEVDPKNPKTVLQRVIDATTGVRVKPVMLQVPEKTALKEQIRLKARETREAKKAQKETADAVVEAIKALELRGPMRPKQAQALAKRAAKVIWTSEKSMENFMAYAERVMANTNYDADLREAKAAQKRAKELSKRESIAAPQRFVLEAIGNIGINLLNDPREFADVVNHYLRSFKPVVSEAYVVVPDAEMESYLSMAEDEVSAAKAEFEVEDNEKLAEKYGVGVNDLQRFLDAEDIMDALESYAKREAIEGILNEKSSNVKEALKGVDTTTLRADQRKLIDAMKVIDVKSLDAAEKQAYIRIGNNIIFNNNQTNGAEFFVATAKGQQAARDLAKNTAAMTKNKAWANILPSLGSRKAKKVLKSWASELQSIADTFRNAFGKEAMTVFYEAMGMVDLDLGFTQAARTLEEIQEKMAKFYDKLDKKYKGAARTQDGILSEGIVGYLIQNVPAKGEAESLAQRRNLMQQNVSNLRKSGDEDKIQMADRIQQLMQRLDGDTVDQTLSNLKREYPANYESLMWLKDDLFPQYKDFLKFSDENFNDQANNYNTPNYLPIIYSNASPALDLLQGKKKYYDNLSSSPKQSSYTIKRSDYTQLPMGSDGRTPKEIGLNLRKNAYNSLSDQITRAYTNPARQRIYSFLKTPEAEEALGGKANLDFFADRIERLMGSRERRGSLNEGFFGKAVDVLANLVRDVGTRIALAGSYQLIRQPADQVTVAVGATGRADLMAEHLAPRSIQNARPVLDLFSIGRRGDASSGYKYINQMEGAQSRLERYYTEGNWVKAKEAAKRFSDKFMTPLKVSDFTVAAATWMTFYRAYLAKNGIKFTTWEDAANLIKSDDVGHRKAAAYAENMTDIYQGSSDPTKMAVFAQKGKTGTENLLKSILVPFNSFGIQFRARVSSDITEIFTRSGDWKGKAIAVKDLSATIGGTVMFGLAKRFVLPAITYGGIKILYAIFGVDVEEPDEEKKKEEFDQKWRQLQGDIISTMVAGGFGQMIEGHTIDGMNYIKYMIDTANESESVLDDDGEIMSFNEYSKERAPFYRYRSFDNAPSLGMLDIGMDQAGKAVLNTKMVLTPEEMERFTPEEQRFLYVALLSDWLYLGGFNDADFARMWDKARRDMIKARKEEEKELQRIRSGR